MQKLMTLLAIFCLLPATATPFSSNDPGLPGNPDETAASSCNLPPPAWVNVIAVGSTWATIQWPAVSGAAFYNIKTYDVATSNLVDESFSFTAGTMTIDGLLPNHLYQVQVRSGCPNGQTSSGGSVDAYFSTIIIDLIVEMSGPSCGNPDPANTCTPLSNGASCSFSWPPNGDDLWIELYDTNNQSEQIFVDLPNANHVDLYKVPGGDFDYDLVLNEEGPNPILQVLQNNSVVYTFGFSKVDYTIVIEGVSSNFNYLKYKAYKCGGGNKLVRQDVASIVNPFADALEIRLPSPPKSGGASIHLFNLNGNVVLSSPIPEGEDQLQLQAGALSDGFYLLRITTAEGFSETRKVVKSTAVNR